MLESVDVKGSQSNLTGIGKFDVTFGGERGKFAPSRSNRMLILRLNSSNNVISKNSNVGSIFVT